MQSTAAISVRNSQERADAVLQGRIWGTHTLIRKNQIFTLFRDEAPERLFMIRRVRSSMLDGSHRQDCPECGPGFAPHPTWCEGRDSVYVPRVPLVERELVEWETVGTTSE